MKISDLNISAPFEVYAVFIGRYIFSMMDPAAPGDIPPDVACLQVAGIRSIDNVTIIDVYK